MKLTKVFGSFMASASPLFHPETWQKYLARHIDLLHSSQSLSCVTASVPCCRVQLSNLFNLVLLRKLGSPPSPCSDVAEIRPFLITRKSMGHPTSEDQGSDPAIKGLPKKSSPVVPASFESQVEVSFSQQNCEMIRLKSSLLYWPYARHKASLCQLLTLLPQFLCAPRKQNPKQGGMRRCAKAFS